MSQPVLSIQSLRVAFETPAGRTVAVRDVSLDLHPTRTLALVGESGSGKSATALSVLRLLPSPPAHIEQGAVWFRPENRPPVDLLTADARTLRSVRGSGVSMIFQEPMSALNPVMTIGAQMIEAIRLHTRTSRKSARLTAHAALAEVALPDPPRALASYPHELSGGMRQRAMIAMALTGNPSVLLADEPTTALDAAVQSAILNLLRERQRARSMALLLITHALNVARAVADDIAVMYAGRIVELAPAADLLASPRHPYTRALLSCAPSTRHRPDRLATVDAVLADPAERNLVPGAPASSRPWWPSEPNPQPPQLATLAPNHHVLLASSNS